MQQTCRLTGKTFLVPADEIALCESLHVPVSDIAPEERVRICMAERNEWKRYHRTCDKTGSPIISGYPAGSPYTVYRNDIWWGDTWEALDYGKPFDVQKPFFEQFLDLQKRVPREGTSIFQCENCDYNSHVRYSRNCYLNSLAANCEDTYYSYWTVRGKNCFDCAYSNDNTLCYDCVDCNNCYGCIAAQDSTNCNDCFFSYQLTGCKNCILCTNLANKTYCIRNNPCTKEEYEQTKRTLLSGSWKQLQDARDELQTLRLACTHRSVHMLNCENVTGDHIYNSRNCVDCFEGSTCEDCSFCVSLGDSKNVNSGYSIGWPGSELIYFSSMMRGCNDVAFSTYMWFSSNIRYCDSCQTCKNCFGCVGLRQKQYCILNKQYSKEEYESLVPKLIEHMTKTGEWGAFFPLDSFPHAYNESAAQDRMPLTKQDALTMGYRWSDYEEDPPDVKKIIDAAQLPDTIDAVPDDILQWAVRCASTNRPFRIIKQELDFYRGMRLPIPRLHPTERHLRRMALRNPVKLWKRSCAKCGKNIQTTYAPERPEAVFCEECYRETVY